MRWSGCMAIQERPGCYKVWRLGIFCGTSSSVRDISRSLDWDCGRMLCLRWRCFHLDSYVDNDHFLLRMTQRLILAFLEAVLQLLWSNIHPLRTLVALSQYSLVLRQTQPHRLNDSM